jgi:hypothetical protein
MKQIAEETSYEAEQSIRKNHNLIVMWNDIKSCGAYIWSPYKQTSGHREA